MKVGTGRKSRNNVRLLFVFSLFILGVSHAEEDVQTEESVNGSGVSFTRLDTADAIDAYREQRYIEAVEGLAPSPLADVHKDMLANAIAKMYLGVPMSSFLHTEREESAKEEPTEQSHRWVVSEEGKIQREGESVFESLSGRSPFISMPPLPYKAESGRLKKESDSEAIFVFDIDMTMDPSEESDMSGMAEKMKFVAEITVNKLDQAPKSFLVKLEKPIRKRFLFKLTTIEIELQYSYIEECEGFAVKRMSVQMDGSAIVVGRLFESAESTFEDIVCEKPLRFMLPSEYESNFLQF